MSYDIQLFRTATKEWEQKSGDESFFENEENLEPFTQQQIQELKERLLKYDFELQKDGNNGICFSHTNYSISVLMTDRALYFTASGDGIFEAGMTASEFTDTGEFAKYDPQSGGWEEI